MLMLNSYKKVISVSLGQHKVEDGARFRVGLGFG